jgi:hypothetical protein
MSEKTERIRKRVRLAGLGAERTFKKALVRRAGLQTEQEFFGPGGVFAKAGHTRHLEPVSHNPGILVVDDPVYNERVKFPKYSGTISPLSAHGSDGVKLLVRRLPHFKKSDHAEHARAHLDSAVGLDRQYQDLISDELEILKGKGIDRGPLISGVISERFPDAVKSRLRELATWITKHKGAAWLHDQAAHSRMTKNPITLIGAGNPGESWHRSKASWAKGKRDRFEGTTYAHGFWSGEKVAHEDSAAAARKIRGQANPAHRINAGISGVLYNRCVEIRAEKTSAKGLKGLYYHPFLERSKVCVLALDNGDILIHSKAGEKLWKLD